jgi:hypothetical protein
MGFHRIKMVMEKKMNNGQEQSVEHIISVDDNIEMRLKIPIKLDVLSFTAILEKSRRLLKMGEVSVISSGRRNVGRPVNGFSAKPMSPKEFKIERNRRLLDEYNALPRGEGKEALVKKYGLRDVSALQNKIYNLRVKFGGK